MDHLSVQNLNFSPSFKVLFVCYKINTNTPLWHERFAFLCLLIIDGYTVRAEDSISRKWFPGV